MLWSLVAVVLAASLKEPPASLSVESAPPVDLEKAQAAPDAVLGSLQPTEDHSDVKTVLSTVATGGAEEHPLKHEISQVKGRIFDSDEEKARFEQSKHEMEYLTAKPVPYAERVKACSGKCGEGLRLFTVWTTGAEGWNHKYTHSIDSALFHHPKARVTLYSTSLPADFLDDWKALGYDVGVETINLQQRAANTPLAGWAGRLSEWHSGPYFYAHLSDALRLVVLYTEGGVYFDTDVVFVNPMDDVHNAVGWERPDSLCNALMAFDKGNPYLREVLTRFNDHYEMNDWAANGPLLLTSVYNDKFRGSTDVRAEEKASFYLISWLEIQKFFDKSSEKDVEHDLAILRAKGYVVHFWNSRSHDLVVHPQSLMAKLFVTYCVYCQPLSKASWLGKVSTPNQNFLQSTLEAYDAVGVEYVHLDIETQKVLI